MLRVETWCMCRMCVAACCACVAVSCVLVKSVEQGSGFSRFDLLPCIPVRCCASCVGKKRKARI